MTITGGCTGRQTRHTLPLVKARAALSITRARHGEVRLTLPPPLIWKKAAPAACTVTALELESGDISSDCPSAFSGRFGNGTRKWRLLISADHPLQVLSLLKSSTGEQLANLSAAARDLGFAPADNERR